MTTPYKRLDKNQAAVLLVDHQAGLLSLVRDIEPDRFKNNVLALGDLAKYFNLPTILTTSFENGPNGPLVPELKAQFPEAPYIARPGQINASSVHRSGVVVDVNNDIHLAPPTRRVDGSVL
jgi:nicotinamidase-related amidase